MTKKNLADLTILLDRSGSMETIKGDMEGALDHFLESQKLVPGDLNVTFYQFDSEAFEKVWGPVSVHSVSKIQIVPRGCTPLMDAMSRAIKETGERLAAVPESERPSKVIFAAITDGLENSSIHTTREFLRGQIDHQRQVYKWEFLYFGANQDAFAEAQSYGIKYGYTYTASPLGVRAFSANINQVVTSTRTEDSTTANVSNEN